MDLSSKTEAATASADSDEASVALQDEGQMGGQHSTTESPPSRCDEFLEGLVCVYIATYFIIGPIVVEVVHKFNLSRALGIASGIIAPFILAMARLRKRRPLAFLHAVYFAMFFYVDVMVPIDAAIVLTMPFEKAEEERPILMSTIYIVPVLFGWLILVLLGRKTIFGDHDYTFFETLAFGDNDDGQSRELLDAVFQRGIDKDDFRYKYVPKTHLMIFTSVCIVLWTIYSGVVWRPSLAITIPIAVVSIVDIPLNNPELGLEGDALLPRHGVGGDTTVEVAPITSAVLYGTYEGHITSPQPVGEERWRAPISVVLY